MRKAIKYSLRLITINTTVLISGLLALELLFGNWLSPNRLNRLNLLKNVDTLYAVNQLYGTPDQTAHYRRDMFGLRGYYLDPAAIDILTIGGSTTDQRHITEGETWQDILRAQFLENGRDITVVNAGVDGQTTYGHLKSFDWWFPNIPGLHLNYCLFYTGINDFHQLSECSYDDLVRHPPGSIIGILKERSALYYLYRTLRGIYSAQVVHGLGHHSVNFQKLEWIEDTNLQDHETLMEPVLDAYTARLQALIGKSRELGATPIFVTQPTRKYRRTNGQVRGVRNAATFDGQEITGIDYYIMMKLLNQRTMEVCRESDCIGIDMAAELEMEDTDFYDFSHTTPQGCRKIGIYLHEKLAPLLACFSEP